MAEVFRLDVELARAQAKMEDALERLGRVIERDEARLDTLLESQKAIVDSRLGLGQPTPTPKEFKPIKTRESWSQAQARVEARNRESYWKDKIEALEKDVEKDVSS